LREFIRHDDERDGEVVGTKVGQRVCSERGGAADDEIPAAAIQGCRNALKIPRLFGVQ